MMLRIVFSSAIVLTIGSTMEISRADDRKDQSPESAVRQAAKALHAKGATMEINGDFQVISVSFTSTSQARDADLVYLQAFTKLETLTLTGQFTDAGLKHVQYSFARFRTPPLL